VLRITATLSYFPELFFRLAGNSILAILRLTHKAQEQVNNVPGLLSEKSEHWRGACPSLLSRLIEARWHGFSGSGPILPRFMQSACIPSKVKRLRSR